jgi:hypothetical protein
MRSEQRQIVRLLLVLVMLVTIGLLSLPPGRAKAADDPCGRTNQVFCINQALTDFQSCCNTYGDAGCATFCVTQFDADYNGCMVLKGCASPPPPVL